MKRMMVVSGVVGVIAGIAFLFTGMEKLFLTCFICMMAALVSWIEYEMELADKEIEMQIEEWNIQQEREHEVLVTKSAIRRELIKTWEEIA